MLQHAGDRGAPGGVDVPGTDDEKHVVHVRELVDLGRPRRHVARSARGRGRNGVVENPGRAFALVVAGDQFLKEHGREEALGHRAIAVQNAGVLEPILEFELAGTGNSLAVENGTGDPRSVTPGTDVIGDVGRGDTGQETERRLPIDCRFQEIMPFLEAAIDDADGGRVRRRGNDRHLLLGLGYGSARGLRKGYIVGLDHFEEKRVVQNEVAESFARDSNLQREAVGEHRLRVRLVEVVEHLAAVEIDDIFDFSVPRVG